MKLATIWIFLLLVCMVRTIYIPHPKNPDRLVPVKIDKSRPQVQLNHFIVEQAPESTFLTSLFYLLFTIPIMFRALKKATGSAVGTSGSGNGITVVTGKPCCD